MPYGVAPPILEGVPMTDGPAAGARISSGKFAAYPRKAVAAVTGADLCPKRIGKVRACNRVDRALERLADSAAGTLKVIP